MAQPGNTRRTAWGWCRCSFRICRIAVLAAVFLLLAGLTWLRLFGLPGFFRVQLVDELARHGVIANFRSLHFHWFRGFVAEDLRVAWNGTNNAGIQIQIAEADLDVAPPLAWRNTSSLLRGFSVRRGSVSLPLLLSNEPPVELRLQDIAAQVRFRPGDHWEIPRLAASLEGFRFELTAQITNTAAFRRPRPETQRPDPAARERFTRLTRSVVQELRTWTPSSSARFSVNLGIDGNNLPATQGDLFFEVPSARSPQGQIVDLRVSVRTQPATGTNTTSHASVIVELADLQSPHGGVSRLAFRSQLTGPSSNTLLTNATWEASADHIFNPSFRVRELAITAKTHFQNNPDLLGSPSETQLQGHAARIELAPGNPEPTSILHASLGLRLVGRVKPELPSTIDGTLAAGSIQSSRGSAGPTTIHIDLATPSSPPPTLPPDAASWAPVWPLAGTLDIDVADLKSPRLDVARFRGGFQWLAPRLAIRQIDASLYQGRLRARGDLDVVSRLATLTAESSFDLHGIDALLGPRSRENFVRYQWAAPPAIEAQGRVTLPPWNATNVDWETTVKPTVRVDGRLKVGYGSFKGIPFDTAESSISFDGATWRLPDLRTSRPEGRQEIAVEYNEDTHEYRIDARGRVLPPVLKPVLGDQSAEIVDLFEFRSPVDAVVSVWGPWTEGTRQAILGNVVATNFSFRSQRFDRLEANVSYTNRFLRASPVLLTRDAGKVTADGVGYDFAEDRLWLTNAVSDIDHVAAAAAINPSFPARIVHYRFASPPRIRANGTLRPLATESADMRFLVSGGPFEFWRLRAETIESELIWKGTSLTLTNISARFFDGTLAGNAFFNLENPDDGLYRFDAQIRQSELGPLLRHATGGHTNVPTGRFNLDLNVTSARTADLYSWNGSGRAELKDGLLWDAPLFSFLSPVLNAVLPGLGNNRARDADATFTLTNSVLHTRDLTIDCPPAKLFYRGTLDFDQRLNAKVEAQILGNFTPMGPLFGLILRPLTKLFEFRTTGTLTDVKAEPLYVPKFLLLPLQPFRLLRGIFGGDSGSRTPPSDSQPEIPVPIPPDPTPVDPKPVDPPKSDPPDFRTDDRKRL